MVNELCIDTKVSKVWMTIINPWSDYFTKEVFGYCLFCWKLIIYCWKQQKNNFLVTVHSPKHCTFTLMYCLCLINSARGIGQKKKKKKSKNVDTWVFIHIQMDTKVIFGNSFCFLFSKTYFWEYKEKTIFLYFWNKKHVWLAKIKKIVFWRKE